METIKQIFSAIIVFVVLSCENNNFYFDNKSQVLSRCNGGGIRNLEITNDSLRLYYSINWYLAGSSPVNFSFDNINEGYRITLNGTKPISPANFKLPEAIYKVEHRSNGDASPDVIQIEIKR